MREVKGKLPFTLPKDTLREGLTYDSLVEFKENHQVIRGVIRWMGHTGDHQKIIVGIETVLFKLALSSSGDGMTETPTTAKVTAKHLES